MTKKHSTKRTLIASILVLCLCLTSFIGTTFAWFTDSVTSSGNKIQSGTLKIDLLHKVEETWISVSDNSDHKIFNYEKWEPGYTRVEALKAENLGTLALKYKLSLEVEDGSALLGANGENLADVIDVYTFFGQTAVTDLDTIKAAWTSKGTLTEVMKNPASFIGGELLPKGTTPSGTEAATTAVGEQVMMVALTMREGAGNEYQNLSVGNIYVNLIATQFSYEGDSFGKDYDNNSQWPNNVIVGANSATATVTPTTEGKVDANGVDLESADQKISASVPEGVQLESGATALTLTVGSVNKSEANITLDETEASVSIDVHIAGVAASNTVPIKVYIKELLPTGLNIGNYRLYHVENGATNLMTYLTAGASADHNTFDYDPATGDVYLYLKSFSEVALVADTVNPWKGTIADDFASGNGTEATPYIIANADQLAYFGAVVGGMNGQTKDSFAGKYIKLVADVNLGYGVEGHTYKIFYPIGYYNTDGTYERTNTAITSGFYTFEGTFDGNGNTISNFYQNTWEMKGDNNYYDATLQYYRDGMGLFGKVYCGTVKNLTVKNFSSDGEYTTTGTIAAYAEGATFENIAIFNCNPRVYNIGNGGIVGCVGWYAKEAGLTTTFKNITVDNSNKISALWGSWDVACGGLVGQYYPTSGQTSAGTPKNAGIHFENCHVSAQIDVYNDVCANYQYYAYRYAGMMIGSIRENETIDGHVYPKMDGITASGCTVHFGDWNDYYYCELVANSLASYTHDHQMSRLEQVASVDTENMKVTDLDGNTTDIPASGRINYVVVKAKDAKGMWIHGDGHDYAECYHFVNGVQHFHDVADTDNPNPTETVNGVETLKEDKQLIYREFNQLFTGYGWGVTSKGLTDYEGVENMDITAGDHEASVEKFETNFTGEFLYRVGNQNTVALGSLFKAKEGAEIISSGVWVKVEKLDENMNVSGTFTPNTSDWTKATIQFSGTGVVKVTIQDYFFCTPTVLYLEVVDAKNITSVESSADTNVVLLNNVKISSNGNANYTNCTVYGNGFTFDVQGGMNQYNSKQGHGIIIINNATLDHLKIVGDVYDEYGMYTTDLYGNSQNDYTAAVDATNSIIQNSYIANCAAPIRAKGITLVDTTLYGGTVANLLISGGTNTLTNVTTVNYNDGRGVIGMGIVITDGAADNTKLILNGYLKQHNYVYETDINQITVEQAKTVFNSMFKDQFINYHIGSNPKAVNTGIISINSDIKLTDDYFEDNIKTGYILKNVNITVSAQGIEKTVEASVASSPSSSSVDNKYVYDFSSRQQGDYLPTFEFDLGDQILAKDNDNDTRYLIGDKNGLTAMYPKDESAITLDLTKLAESSKYLGTSYVVSAKCIGPDGEEQTGMVTLDKKGTYTLVFTVDDNIFFDQNGNAISKSVTRTYEVTLVLDLYEKSIADATITISSSALTGEYVTSGSNKKYKMYPLKAITSIMDDANKDGTLEDFNVKANIESAVLTPESNNAFSSPTTITITYTGGQVLTIVLGTPSGLNSPGASNGGKTFSVKTDNTNGIYLQSDGAVASSSAATGTWPLTSWSFKGTSGKVITDNTKVTINFTKPSTCVTPDTLITLADGTQKRIDEVTYADQILVWNFYTGEYDVVSSAIIFDHGYDYNTVITLNFSDGTSVKAVNLHQFFDADLNEFVSIDANSVADYVGHKFAKSNGNGFDAVTLLDYTVSVEYVEAWGIISSEHYNIFVEGMLSTDFMLEDYDLFNCFEIGENMTFDEAKMQSDIEKYGLYTYEDFADYLTYEQFVAFNVQYFKIAVGKGNYTYEGILDLIDTYLNQ